MYAESDMMDIISYSIFIIETVLSFITQAMYTMSLNQCVCSQFYMISFHLEMVAWHFVLSMYEHMNNFSKETYLCN